MTGFIKVNGDAAKKQYTVQVIQDIGRNRRLPRKSRTFTMAEYTHVGRDAAYRRYIRRLQRIGIDTDYSGCTDQKGNFYSLPAPKWSY
jgi:hypothetical protein